MKFIGRKAEMSKLNAEYERGGGFVVIYGRRRVGKTTLIKEVLKKKTTRPSVKTLSITTSKPQTNILIPLKLQNANSISSATKTQLEIT